MHHLLPTAPTFSLSRSIDFLAGFPPCQGELVLGPTWVGGAFAIGERAVAYTVRTADQPGALAIDTASPAVVAKVADFLGVGDQLGRFYARAAGDVAAYRTIVHALHGLHHVRFRTLEEVTVQAVLGQRTPILLAAKQKRQVSAALGPRTGFGGREVTAFPTFDQLVPLGPDDWHEILANRAKAGRMTSVIRGVAALGETWLRAAPYAIASARLQAIDGVGPFSAAMILLRGLGRMDDVPLEVPGIARVAAEVYGDAWDPAAVRARYGEDIGYWSFYLKVGASRVKRARARAA